MKFDIHVYCIYVSIGKFHKYVAYKREKLIEVYKVDSNYALSV